MQSSWTHVARRSQLFVASSHSVPVWQSEACTGQTVFGSSPNSGQQQSRTKLPCHLSQELPVAPGIMQRPLSFGKPGAYSDVAAPLQRDGVRIPFSSVLYASQYPVHLGSPPGPFIAIATFLNVGMFDTLDCRDASQSPGRGGDLRSLPCHRSLANLSHLLLQLVEGSDFTHRVCAFALPTTAPKVIIANFIFERREVVVGRWERDFSWAKYVGEEKMRAERR